jgi:hypothetical protein
MRRRPNLCSRFKPTAQLATPPPDSPGEQTKGDRPTKAPTLSPFASQLFQQIDVHYLRKLLSLSDNASH